MAIWNCFLLQLSIIDAKSYPTIYVQYTYIMIFMAMPWSKTLVTEMVRLVELPLCTTVFSTPAGQKASLSGSKRTDALCSIGSLFA